MKMNKPFNVNYLQISKLVKPPYIRSKELYQWSEGAAS